MARPFAERVAAVQSAAEQLIPAVLSLTERIARIPAPTGDEAARSDVVAGEFTKRGFSVDVDDLGDVVATLPGTGASSPPPLLVAAHLDTVFAKETPLVVSRGDGTLHGPGIGDNTLSVAALLVLPELLTRAGESPTAPVLLAANVGEEGLGNLRGMRAVMDARPDIGAAIAVEGHNLGRVTHIAVGSRRLRLRAVGPGGHSWGDFGQPSAIHALSRLIAELDRLPLPQTPKTTLNIGVISGGVSVNTIAPEATCLLDLRSVEAESLEKIAAKVNAAIAVASRDGVTVTAELLGERPAGIVALNSPVIRIATEALRALGFEPAFDASSTDANVPIGRGVPAVCIGLTTGGNVHREDEFIHIAPVADGLAQLALLTLGLCDGLASGSLAPKVTA